MAALDLFTDEIDEGLQRGHIIDLGNPEGIVCPHDVGVIGVDPTTSRSLAPGALSLFRSTIASPEPSLFLGFGLGVELAEILDAHPDANIEGLSLTPVSPYRLVNLNGASIFTERRDSPHFKEWVGDCEEFINAAHASGRRYRFVYDNNGPLYHMGDSELMDGVGKLLTPNGSLFCVALGVPLPKTSLDRGQMAYWHLAENSILVLGPEHPSRRDADNLSQRAMTYDNVRRIMDEEDWFDLMDLI